MQNHPAPVRPASPSRPVTEALRRTGLAVRRVGDAARSALARAGRALGHRLASDRGDVPGWVLITLMTAGIVIALWAVASEQIVTIFSNALKPFLDGSIGD